MKKNILLFLALFLMTAIGARADGNELEITKVNETTWEFTMPDKAVDLQLTFTDGSTAVVSVNNCLTLNQVDTKSTKNDP